MNQREIALFTLEKNIYMQGFLDGFTEGYLCSIEILQHKFKNNPHVQEAIIALVSNINKGRT